MTVLPRSLTWQVHDIAGAVFGVATERGTCVGVGISPRSAILRAVIAARQKNVAVDFIDGGQACKPFKPMMRDWFEANHCELPQSESMVLRNFFKING